jgi:hypothetical protein
MPYSGILCYVAFARSVLQLLVTADVSSLPILVTPMIRAICSSETSVLTRATQHNIPEGGILQWWQCVPTILQLSETLCSITEM